MKTYLFNIEKHREIMADLGAADDLVFRRLIDVYYLREGPLPKDITELARLVDYDADVVAGVVEHFFRLTDEGWRREDLDADIAARKPLKVRGRPRKIEIAP